MDSAPTSGDGLVADRVVESVILLHGLGTGEEVDLEGVDEPREDGPGTGEGDRVTLVRVGSELDLLEPALLGELVDVLDDFVDLDLEVVGELREAVDLEGGIDGGDVLHGPRIPQLWEICTDRSPAAVREELVVVLLQDLRSLLVGLLDDLDDDAPEVVDRVHPVVEVLLAGGLVVGLVDRSGLDHVVHEVHGRHSLLVRLEDLGSELLVTTAGPEGVLLHDDRIPQLGGICTEVLRDRHLHHLGYFDHFSSSAFFSLSALWGSVRDVGRFSTCTVWMRNAR